jgi:hypothetical protein
MILALLGAHMVRVVNAQSRSTSDEAVAALVTEVRALRADVAEASQRALRFELLLARLQMQEQRIAYLDRQRLEIGNTLAAQASVATALAMPLKAGDQACRSGSPDEREACERQFAFMKQNWDEHQKREQALRTQELEVQAAIATEQGRWSDFNARLDELERSLSRRQ